MKTILSFAVGAFFVGIIFCGDAFAGVDDSVVQKRMIHQQAQIEQRIRICQVTPLENEQLLRNQRRMEWMKEQRNSENAVTQGERSRLRHRLNNSNRHIYRQGNTGQRGRR